MTAVAAVVLAIAPFVGYFLSQTTKEELESGKKYFVLAHHILFIAVAFVFMYAYRQSIWAIVLGILAVFTHLVLKKARSPALVQAFFGLTFAFTAQTQYLSLLSSFIFLFGLPTGALFAMQKKGFNKMIFASAVFLIIALGALL